MKGHTMTPTETEQTVQNLEQVVRDYLVALDAKDLAACVALYSDDAVIHFMSGIYKGRKGVEEWHRDRFAANLQLLQIDEIQTTGDSVVVDVVVTSDRIKGWMVNGFPGRLTYLFEGGLIKEARYGLRTTSQEIWRL
jgi:ketosteroid isomerase-like protein